MAAIISGARRILKKKLFGELNIFMLFLMIDFKKEVSMRERNREIGRRRHRKEKARKAKIKALIAEAKKNPKKVKEVKEKKPAKPATKVVKSAPKTATEGA